MKTRRVILVTGGAGHVGSHVIEQLVNDPNNRVISLDNYSNGSTENHILGADYRHGDTTNIQRLVPERPNLVFHLGEYARIAPSFREVAKVFKSNAVGTFEVVQFCRFREVDKLIYAASSTKFADNGAGRHESPYAYYKAANVDLINNYGVWYGLPYAICYLNNGFGPREKDDYTYGTLIAKYQRAYLEGRPLAVNGNGLQQRRFTFVGDLARGMIMVAENGQGDNYVLGHEKKYSVLEIARAFGGSVELKPDDHSGRVGPGATPNRAREELGWDTTVDVLDYIRDFVAQHPR